MTDLTPLKLKIADAAIARQEAMTAASVVHTEKYATDSEKRAANDAVLMASSVLYRAVCSYEDAKARNERTPASTVLDVRCAPEALV